MDLRILRDDMELNLKEDVRASGRVEIEAFDAKTVKRGPDGDVLEGDLLRRILQENMVVDAGLDFIRAAISRSMTPMKYIAAGTGSTAADPSDTALETEIERVLIIGYDDSATGAIRFRAIFESNQANGSLQEFGIFNDPTAGTMLARTVLGAPFDKDTSYLLRVNWTVTYADA
jgi:hypothetical protein